MSDKASTPKTPTTPTTLSTPELEVTRTGNRQLATAIETLQKAGEIVGGLQPRIIQALGSEAARLGIPPGTVSQVATECSVQNDELQKAVAAIVQQLQRLLAGHIEETSKVEGVWEQAKNSAREALATQGEPLTQTLRAALKNCHTPAQACDGIRTFSLEQPSRIQFQEEDLHGWKQDGKDGGVFLTPTKKLFVSADQLEHGTIYEYQERTSNYRLEFRLVAVIEKNPETGEPLHRVYSIRRTVFQNTPEKAAWLQEDFYKNPLGPQTTV